MFGLGTTELILITILVLAIFGAGKLPDVGGALGRGIRSFRKAAQEREPIDITPATEKKEEKKEDD